MKDTRYSNSKKVLIKFVCLKKSRYFCKTFGCGSSGTIKSSR